MIDNSRFNDQEDMREENVNPETGDTSTERSQQDNYSDIGSKGGTQRQGYQEERDKEDVTREEYEDV